MTTRKAQLLVRLSGPGVREGRILLGDLVKFGHQLESALNRVAVALSTVEEPNGAEPKSARALARRVRPHCALEVVAMQPGSFELGLDIRREPEPAQAGLFEEEAKLGEIALAELIAGLEEVATNAPGLPRGYDVGVLAAWREAGRLFDHGIDKVQFDLDTPAGPRKAEFDPTVLSKVVERIRAPVKRSRTVEGRLLMADFKLKATKCRIHPQTGDPIQCDFDEAMADVVKEHLRSFVRVTGEAEEDEKTGRVRRLHIVDIEPLAVSTDVGSLNADEFWLPKSLEQLAAEQGIDPVQDLSALVGSASSLWGSDEDFEKFVAGIHERRHETGEDRG